MSAINAKVNDFISFTETIQPAVKAGFVTIDGKATATPSIPPLLVKKSGGGIVLKLHKAVAKHNGRKLRTASVDAGKWLGVVKAVLDTATMTGVQESLLIHEAAPVAAMYHTDSKGGA